MPIPTHSSTSNHAQDETQEQDITKMPRDFSSIQGQEANQLKKGIQVKEEAYARRSMQELFYFRPSIELRLTL